MKLCAIVIVVLVATRRDQLSFFSFALTRYVVRMFDRLYLECALLQYTCVLIVFLARNPMFGCTVRKKTINSYMFLTIILYCITRPQTFKHMNWHAIYALSNTGTQSIESLSLVGPNRFP